MRKFLCFYILTEREMDQIQCEIDELVILQTQ